MYFGLLGGSTKRGISFPITTRPISSNIVNSEQITKSKSKAPKTAAPGSTHIKVDNENPDVIVSKTKYNEHGLPEYREDYHVGSKSHSHFDKKTKTQLKNHRHRFHYNDKGQQVGSTKEPI